MGDVIGDETLSKTSAFIRRESLCEASKSYAKLGVGERLVDDFIARRAIL
jgi:hypothetical protein